EGEEDRHSGNAQHEVVRRERADRHERRRPKRHLARVSGEDVETERSERKDQERDQDRRKEIRRRGERNDDECERDDDRDADAILPDWEDRRIRGIRRFELAGFAVEHPYIRRMIFSPNSPSGRTSRNTSASTYGNQPSMPPPTYGPI